MFTIKNKPNADFYWKLLSSNSLKETTEDFGNEENNYISNGFQSFASMDSFAEACLNNMADNDTLCSTDSREFCKGRSLYDSTDMGDFYDHLKKVQGTHVYMKYLRKVPPKEKPSRMAELLAGNISNDVRSKSKNSSKGFKNVFGKCFSRFINKTNRKNAFNTE